MHMKLTVITALMRLTVTSALFSDNHLAGNGCVMQWQGSMALKGQSFDRTAGHHLYSSIDVAVQPVDLHTGFAANQNTHKGTAEDAIAIEVPVVAEPDAASSQQTVPEHAEQQPERLPIIAYTTQKRWDDCLCALW